MKRDLRAPGRRARAAQGRRPARRRGTSAGYHHGALREALLEAAAGLLQEQGVERFTLRECARRAGVSHAAPAHHFGDARGLLTALAARGFERLTALMQQHCAHAPDEPAAQLRAVGQAYIEFALANRAHFQLMFRHDRLARDDAALQEAGAAAFEQLRSALTRYMQAQGREREDLSGRLLLAWSVVHGFATLVLEDQVRGFRGARTPAAFARAAGGEVLRLLEAGLLTPAP